MPFYHKSQLPFKARTPRPQTVIPATASKPPVVRHRPPGDYTDKYGVFRKYHGTHNGYEHYSSKGHGSFCPGGSFGECN